jgi:hypothetical protein
MEAAYGGSTIWNEWDSLFGILEYQRWENKMQHLFLIYRRREQKKKGKENESGTWLIECVN